MLKKLNKIIINLLLIIIFSLLLNGKLSPKLNEHSYNTITIKGYNNIPQNVKKHIENIKDILVKMEETYGLINIYLTQQNTIDALNQKLIAVKSEEKARKILFEQKLECLKNINIIESNYKEVPDNIKTFIDLVISKYHIPKKLPTGEILIQIEKINKIRVKEEEFTDDINMFNAKQKVLYLRGDLKEEKHYQTLKITKMKEYEEFKAMFDKEKKILKKMIIKYYKEMPEWLKEVTKLELK